MCDPDNIGHLWTVCNESSGILEELLNHQKCSSKLILLPLDQRESLPLKPRLDSTVLLYDDQGSIIDFYDFFSVMQGQAVLNLVGNYTDLSGLTLFLQKREDFQGQELRVGAIESFPFITRINASHADGFIVELVATLEDKFNFEARFVASFDGYWGSKVNGTWIGLIKMLVDNDVDFVAADLAMNPQRLQGSKNTDDYIYI